MQTEATVLVQLGFETDSFLHFLIRAKIENERRLNDKKKSSSKKADRRNKGSWD
jgi:hypothetical protein